MTAKLTTTANNPLVKGLIDAGIIPQNCISFKLELDVHKPIKITTEVWATEEQFKTIADALRSHPEAAKDFVHTTFFRPMSHPESDTATEPISVES